MKEENSMKTKLIECYEESKENINFKSQLIISLIQSIKEENNQFFSNGKLKIYKKDYIFIVLSFFDNKKITVNTKSDISTMPILDDKLNENNIVLQASLVNLSSLIQKILEENKKNQERDLSDFYSSNNIILKESSSETTKKSKNIEVNKKLIDLKKSKNRQLNTSPNKSVNERNFVSNIHINTLANIKGLMTNNNFHNYVGNAIEKSQSSATQDEKNSKSIEQSEYIEDSNKIKNKNKKNNMNKTQNSFDYRKNIYNINDNKSEKNINSKNNKAVINLKKTLKSNKLTKERNTFSNKNISHKDILDNIAKSEESKNKEENKDNFINKNKIFNGNNNLNTNSNPNNKKSFQYLNINSVNNNNVYTKNKNNSKNNPKKSLTHYGTKTELDKNKKNKNTNIINKDTNDLIQKLSPKEKSYYILSKSPVLRLNERLLFGRSTNNLRNIQKVSDILKNNEIFLKDKIKELENKIIECEKRTNGEFNPSKTAEINFNFILSKDEEEFKKFGWLAENEKEKNEYYSYIKLIYLLFNEKYENIELKNLIEKLYILINKKGFKTIKEYLYHIYFQKKEKNNIIFNIDKINALFEESNIDKKFNIKFCRFALFTSFLVREIVKYGTELKNMIELKIKTKELIDVINNKLKLYNAAYSFKKK